LLPDANPSKLKFPNGVVCLDTSLRVFAEQHPYGVNYNRGAPVAEGLPEEANAIGDFREND